MYPKADTSEAKNLGKTPIKHSIVIRLIKQITEYSMSMQIKSQPRRGIARLNNIRTVTTPFPRCFLLKLVAESFWRRQPQFSLSNENNGRHEILKYRVDNMSPLQLGQNEITHLSNTDKASRYERLIIMHN